jgi:hypothetical protein
VQACENEYLAKVPYLDIKEQSLMIHIRRIVDRFDKTDVLKGKSSGRPQVAEDIEDLRRERMKQNPRTSLLRLNLHPYNNYYNEIYTKQICTKMYKKAYYFRKKNVPALSPF